jgi:hypothetical protein
MGIKNWSSFKESYIDASGNLNNFNPKLDSEDVLTDKELYSMIDEYYDSGRDIPEYVYTKFTHRHKMMYMENILDTDGGVLITNSENEEFLDDIQNMYPEKLKQVLLNYMELYTTFGNEYLPMSETFIKNMPEDIILAMLKRLSDKLEYPILVLLDEFNLMSEKCKQFIIDHKYRSEDFEGNEDIIKNCFLIDLDM